MAFVPVQDIEVSIGGAAATNGTIFGCMIYSFDMSFGVGEGQTTCSMNIVSEKGIYPPELTKIDPRTGQVKYLSFLTPITLTIGGNTSFGVNPTNRFIMSIYLVSVQEQYGTDGKTFKLDFVDGSHILDRVYVGLLHRHDGNNRPSNILKTKVGFDIPVLCPPCDPFAAPPNNLPTLKTIKPSDPDFGGLVSRNIDMSLNQPIGNAANGGFIIVGSEQFSSSDCQLKDVDYNFTELVRAAAKFGIDIRIKDRKPEYRATHVGTLREVLSSWAGDFGITWVFDSFVSRPPTVVESGNNSPQSIIDIQTINDEARNIKSRNSTALVESIDYSVSIKDTYKQFPVTAYKKPAAPKEDQKTTYYRTYFQHIGPEQMFDKDYLDGRSYEEFVISCALAKFSPELRTLYLLQLGSYAPIGFTPVYKVPDDLKKQIIEMCLNTESYLDMLDYIAGPDASLKDIAKADFDMTLGSYQEEREDEYLEWEKGVADSFGKYFMSSVLGRDVTFCPKGLRFKFQNKTSVSPEAPYYYSKYETKNKKVLCQPAQQQLSNVSQQELDVAQFEARKPRLTNNLPGGLPFNKLLRGPLGQDIFTIAPPYLVQNNTGGSQLKYSEYVRILERSDGAYNVTEADFECQLTNPVNKESLVAKYMPRYQAVEGLIKTRLLASFAVTPDKIRETIEGAKGAVPSLMITPKKKRLRDLFTVSKLQPLANDKEADNTITQKSITTAPKGADCDLTADCELQENLSKAVCSCATMSGPPNDKKAGIIYDSREQAFVDGILSTTSLGFTFAFKPDPLERTVANPDGTFTTVYDKFESQLKVVLPYGMTAYNAAGNASAANNLYQGNYVEEMTRTKWSNKVQAIINDFEFVHDASGNRVRPNGVGNVGTVKVIPIEATQSLDIFPTNAQGGEIVNVTLPPLFDPTTGQPYPAGHAQGPTIVSLNQFHAFMQTLNNLGSEWPKVTLSVALGSMNFGELWRFFKPTLGLQSLDISINESGTSAKVSWGSGLLRLPKQDVIMNQVQPRAKYSMFVP